jgi:ribose 5-phosphate isomerase A
MHSPEEIKKLVGVYAAQFVQQDAVIGLGTGTTVYWLLQELGNRVKQGLRFTAVPTSTQTLTIGTSLGIQFKELNDIEELSITIDGADEADPQLQLIKGGGGALLQEKMVAAATKKLIIIADHTKVVGQLGKFPLPVEVIPFGWKHVQKHIAKLGCEKIVLRAKGNETYITDNHNYILDCWFGQIENPAALNTALHAIPGVVETGLFINMAAEVIAGYPDGRIVTFTQ